MLQNKAGTAEGKLNAWENEEWNKLGHKILPSSRYASR
jgi:hypothetical protein